MNTLQTKTKNWVNFAALWDVQEPKSFQLQGGFAPLTPTRGSAPGPRWGNENTAQGEPKTHWTTTPISGCAKYRNVRRLSAMYKTDIGMVVGCQHSSSRQTDWTVLPFVARRLSIIDVRNLRLKGRRIEALLRNNFGLANCM